MTQWWLGLWSFCFVFLPPSIMNVVNWVSVTTMFISEREIASYQQRCCEREAKRNLWESPFNVTDFRDIAIWMNCLFFYYVLVFCPNGLKCCPLFRSTRSYGHRVREHWKCPKERGVVDLLTETWGLLY